MPQGRINWADRAAQVGATIAQGWAEEIEPFAPEVDLFHAKVTSGTSYSTLVRTGLPSVAFRGLNEGVAPSKSTWDKRRTELYILSGRCEIDRAAYQAGKEEGKTDIDIEAAESIGVGKAAKIAIANQLIYGKGADAKGFQGLKSLLPKGSLITVDATGSQANEGSSIYAVKTGDLDAALVFGGGTVMDLGDFRDGDIDELDPETGLPVGRKIPGRIADLLGWAGLQVNNTKCIGRILNLTAQANKTCNDDILSELFSKFPNGYKPDFYLMSRRSARQLQKSRGVVINVGSNAPSKGSVASTAPMPTHTADGVPIVVTDTLIDTETIE
jgi:hypothetical protein